MNSMDWQVRPENQRLPAIPEALPLMIDGLDLEQMRLRLGGDDEVLLAILRQFLCDFDSWQASFELERRQLNTGAMLRLVHTLKGTAANVCADQVHVAALALETALRQGEGLKAGLVRDCEAALQQVLNALRQQLPPEPGSGSCPIAPDQALLVVQEVAALLHRRRRVPHLLQQELRATVAPLVSVEQLEALFQHMSAFEFKNAQQALTEIQECMST